MPDVDLVVLWVDGSDPLWLAERKKYEAFTSIENTAIYRYRDYGLMQYWFRAVEKNLPWVRKIHFVTWGHLPPFLYTSNPKLNIVRHQDFMPEGTLPCFNSSALEMNMFRIKGLSEHFIYFNDDMFVLRPMAKRDFFTENGIPCLQFTESPPIHKGYRGSWQTNYINDMSIINQYFNKQQCQRGCFGKYFSIKYNWYDNVRSLALKLLFPNVYTGFKTFHAATPFCKKTFETIWSKETELLTEVSRHKFREYTDVNQWLAIWWQMAEGNFHPRRRNTACIALNDKTVDNACQWIINKSYEVICLNDDANESDFQSIMEKLGNALDTIYPEKSSFEK